MRVPLPLQREERPVNALLRSVPAGLVSALLLVLAAGVPARADGALTVLYDVDFSAPTHTVGSPPATGEGPVTRGAPTAIRRNPVRVLAAYGALQDQPMVFPGPGRGEVDFSLLGLPLCPSYHVEMNVVVDSDLRILLYSPFVNMVRLQQNGDIVVTVYDLATQRQTTTVAGTFTPGDGAVHEVVVRVDLTADRFELEVDGALIHMSDFGGQLDLTLMRTAGTRAAVDDIIVQSGEEEVVIDATVSVRPGSGEPAPINLRSRGLLPVAVLGTDDVHASDVDLDTLTLSDGGEGEEVAPRRSRVEDIDGDGVDDVLMHFATGDLVAAGVLATTTASVTVRGTVRDGTALRGSDTVRVVGRRTR